MPPGLVAATSAARKAAFRNASLPLRPLAAAVAIVLSIAAALAVGSVGSDRLERDAKDHAAARAALLSSALAARLNQLTGAGQIEAVQLASRRTGSEFLVVSRDGKILAGASVTAPSYKTLMRVIEAAHGELKTDFGLTEYAARPINQLPMTPMVVAFVRVPSAAEGAPDLISALVALTTLFVGVAAVFAYLVARDSEVDVDLLAGRVRAMVHVTSEPSGESVPLRTFDEVGSLASAFNELVGRFVEAERAYRADLERARGADRDRAAFLAAVSHELRSPLNAILGFADLLLAEVDGPLTDAAREEVDQIRGSGTHLLELINDILEFSALEGGQLKLSRSRVDVAQLASEVLREAAGVLGARPVTVRLAGENGVVIDADPRRVRQVFTNIIGNAIKFTERGEVVVTVSLQDAYARVSVKDSGPGISPEEKDHLFAEYSQAKEERKRRRGTGLGLAIARRLVLLHGGYIEIDSKVGAGSTFHLIFPVEGPRRSTRPPPPGKSNLAKVSA
jgi:signal transduction histidine kinase